MPPFPERIDHTHSEGVQQIPLEGIQQVYVAVRGAHQELLAVVAELDPRQFHILRTLGQVERREWALHG